MVPQLFPDTPVSAKAYTAESDEAQEPFASQIPDAHSACALQVRQVPTLLHTGLPPEQSLLFLHSAQRPAALPLVTQNFRESSVSHSSSLAQARHSPAALSQMGAVVAQSSALESHSRPSGGAPPSPSHSELQPPTPMVAPVPPSPV